MSAEAEEKARNFRHPQVRGSIRTQLEVIAREIADGQTMTRPISLKEIARLMGEADKRTYDKRTARSSRKVLVSVGALRLVGGGRGRVAAYELLFIEGAGAPPALALKSSALIAGVPTVRKHSEGQPDLFTPVAAVDVLEPAESDQPANNIGSKDPTLPTNKGSLILRWLQNVGSRLKQRIKRSLVADKHGIERSYVASPLDVDGTRARAVPLLEEVLLPPAASESPTRPPPDPNPSRCRWFPKTHAWCAGRVHVPTQLDEDFRRKLGRVSGETDAQQQARTWGIYATEAAKIPADQRITAPTDFDHWRPILAAYLARAAPAASPPSSRVQIPIDLYERAEQQRRARRGSAS